MFGVVTPFSSSLGAVHAWFVYFLMICLKMSVTTLQSSDPELKVHSNLLRLNWCLTHSRPVNYSLNESTANILQMRKWDRISWLHVSYGCLSHKNTPKVESAFSTQSYIWNHSLAFCEVYPFLVLKDKGVHFMAHSNFQWECFISIIYGPYFSCGCIQIYVKLPYILSDQTSASGSWEETPAHIPVSITQRASFPRACIGPLQWNKGVIGYTAGCHAPNFPQEMCSLMRNQH